MTAEFKAASERVFLKVCTGKGFILKASFLCFEQKLFTLI